MPIQPQPGKGNVKPTLLIIPDPEKGAKALEDFKKLIEQVKK